MTFTELVLQGPIADLPPAKRRTQGWITAGWRAHPSWLGCSRSPPLERRGMLWQLQMGEREPSSLHGDHVGGEHGDERAQRIRLLRPRILLQIHLIDTRAHASAPPSIPDSFALPGHRLHYTLPLSSEPWVHLIRDGSSLVPFQLADTSCSRRTGSDRTGRGARNPRR